MSRRHFLWAVAASLVWMGCSAPDIDVLTLTPRKAIARAAPTHSKRFIALDSPLATAAELSERERDANGLWDGFVFSFAPNRQALFDTNAWTDLSALANENDNGGSTSLENFVFLDLSDTAGVGWADSAGWATIVANMGLASRAAATFGATGFYLETQELENAHNPFTHSKGTGSFEDAAAIVRKRAQDVASALASSVPSAIFIFPSLMTLVAAQSEQTNDASTIPVALLPAFLQGALEGAPDTARFVDSRYHTLLYDDTDKYFDGYVYAADHAARVVPQEVQERYRTHVALGTTLSAEFVLGAAPGLSPPTGLQRDIWLHDGYYALATSDGEVVCHTGAWRGSENGARDGLLTARAQYEHAAALGFELVKPSISYWDTHVAPAKEATLSATLLPVDGNASPPSRRWTLSASGPPGVTLSLVRNSRTMSRSTDNPFAAADVPMPGSAVYFARVHASDGRHGTSAPVFLSAP